MKRILNVCLILWLSVFSACSKSGGSKTFTVQLITEPPTLDWTLSIDTVSSDVVFNLMEGLVEYDSEFKPKPGLAESWVTSPDGKTYTFKIRPNVKWTDGVPLKAQHFVDSWRRLLDPETAAEYAYFLFDIVNAKEYNEKKAKADDVGVRAIDDSTLEVKLKSPITYFPTLLTFWVTFPLRADVIAKHGNAWTEAANIVTLGPYQLVEWKHDASLKIKANPNYYGEQPPIKDVDYMVVQENTTALTLLETGKIDIMRAEIPPVDIPRLENSPLLHSSPYLRNNYFGFKVTSKPFDNVKVRKAFCHAIDKTLLPKILKGQQIAMDSWIPQGMFGYNPKIGLKFDPEKARKLLAEAGYPNGKNFPKVVMMYDTREEHKLIAETLQSAWKQVLNVDLQIQNQEWKTFLKVVRTEKGPPLFKMGWGADFPDPDNFMNLFTSYSGNNNSHWKNFDFDRMIQVAAQERDASVRQEIYDKAQKLMLEDQPVMVPLYQQRILALVSARTKKISLNPMNNLYLKYWSL